MAGSTRAAGRDFHTIAPTVVLQNAFTFVGFPESPPATASYPGGARRTSARVAVTCTAGTLGVSFNADGSGELQLAAGNGFEGDIATQGLIVRGVGGAATYQAIITLGA
jgi:hypothetical protein